MTNSGIVEVKKVVEALSGSITQILDVDWEKFVEEWKDIDKAERDELIKLVLEKVLALMNKAAEYKLILQLILRIIK